MRIDVLADVTGWESLPDTLETLIETLQRELGAMDQVTFKPRRTSDTESLHDLLGQVRRELTAQTQEAIFIILITKGKPRSEAIERMGRLRDYKCFYIWLHESISQADQAILDGNFDNRIQFYSMQPQDPSQMQTLANQVTQKIREYAGTPPRSIVTVPPPTNQPVSAEPVAPPIPHPPAGVEDEEFSTDQIKPLKPLSLVPPAQTLPKPPPSHAPRIPQGLQSFLKAVDFKYVPIPDPSKDEFWYPEEEFHQLVAETTDDNQVWIMAGASRRGLSHWNKGTHRDDAFAFGSLRGWNIIALADGAGSATFSRVTANRGVKEAVNVVTQFVPRYRATPQDHAAEMKKAIEEAVRSVHQVQEQFTKDQNLTKKDTYTTFLLLVHYPFNQGCVWGTFQVGDGCIFGVSEKGAYRLAKGDHAEDAATTQFVLSFSADELVRRVLVQQTNPVDFFLLATDGIEDDLKPTHTEYRQGLDIDKKLESFSRHLQSTICRWRKWEDWGKLLMSVISYERKGSFDDRTLAILTTRPID